MNFTTSNKEKNDLEIQACGTEVLPFYLNKEKAKIKEWMLIQYNSNFEERISKLLSHLTNFIRSN